MILGGRGKGGDYAPLAAPVAERARAVYLIGETAPEIAAALAATGVPLHASGDLEAALAAARAAARPGEVVLLSPACASYDQYPDYEARGEHFRALVDGCRQPGVELTPDAQAQAAAATRASAAADRHPLPARGRRGDGLLGVERADAARRATATAPPTWSSTSSTAPSASSLMQVIARQGLASVRRYTPYLLLIAFVLLLLVLVPGFGVKINGARRWLGVGPLQFQPAEIMKLALVLHAAAIMSARPKLARNLRTAAGPILGVGAAAILLVAAQPDLGTALVISFTLAAMLVAAGLPLRQLGLIAAVGAFLVLVFAILEPYRRARLTAFMNPWADAGGSGFQSVQGQIALGSGGFFGLGPGQSVQKIFYLPEAHTDFILAVIGEELGVAGICVLLVPLRHDRVRGAADREGRQGRVRQAARRRPHQPDPVPSAAQHLHRPRPRAPHRRPAALHLVGLDVADRAAVLDGAAAQRRAGRHAAAARGEAVA